MATRDCRFQGCRLVFCCVVGGTEFPIGLITAATLNTSESEDNTGYFGGTVSNNQSDVTAADGDGRWQPGGAGTTVYDLCSGTSGCTDELNLTADYCLTRGCTSQFSADFEPQQRLRCGESKHIRIKYVDDNGQAVDLYDAPTAKITSKNRNLTGGVDLGSTFDVTFEIEDATYDNCFH